MKEDFLQQIGKSLWECVVLIVWSVPAFPLVAIYIISELLMFLIEKILIFSLEILAYCVPWQTEDTLRILDEYRRQKSKK